MPLSEDQVKRVKESVAAQYANAAANGKFIPPKVARARALQKVVSGKKVRRKTANLRKARG